MRLVFRLFWTIRYLSFGQVFFRARRIVRRRWLLATHAKAPQYARARLAEHSPLWENFTAPAVRNEQLEAAQALLSNEFSYLNTTAIFESGIGWHDGSLSQLFRYQLHYFHYVLPLLVAHHDGNPESYPTFKRIAQDWIENNQQLKGDGWHPYTLSLRIVNWLHAIAGFAKDLDRDDAFRQQLLSSLYGQCRYLVSDLEHDVRGNHLLANTRALIWAGIALEGTQADRWLQTGLHWLKKEVSEQVLSDGAHFERSPGYHVLVLQDLFEISLYLTRNSQTVPAWLNDAIAQMAIYLRQILRPDDQVPMLKDTAHDACLAPTEILDAISLPEAEGWYAQLLGVSGKQSKFYNQLTGSQLTDNQSTDHQPIVHQPIVHLPVAGNTIFSSDRDWGIVDHGLPCPSYLPAHAQADLFTFEYFVDGLPIVVDSGIFEYAPGRWREYFRSTAAHNTVEVDGKNSTDVWHSFRAARRATPKIVAFQSTPTQMTLTVEHNGYAHLHPSITHRRTFIWRSGQSLTIQDELFGTGTVNAVSRIHLHPSIAPEQLTPMKYKLTAHVTMSGSRPFQKDSGWYSPRFGKKEANACLKQTLVGDLPLRSEIIFQIQ